MKPLAQWFARTKSVDPAENIVRMTRARRDVRHVSLVAGDRNDEHGSGPFDGVAVEAYRFERGAHRKGPRPTRSA